MFGVAASTSCLNNYFRFKIPKSSIARIEIKAIILRSFLREARLSLFFFYEVIISPMFYFIAVSPSRVPIWSVINNKSPPQSHRGGTNSRLFDQDEISTSETRP